MHGLDGRVALVTGAGRGIGAAIAGRLVAEGCRVVVNDRDLDVATEVAAEWGDRAVAVGGSVVDAVAVDAAVSRAAEAFGGLDIVVNAGLTRDRMLHRMSDQEFDEVLDVSLRGTFNVCRSAARLLRLPPGEVADHHRKVVNIASVNGLYGNAGNTNYSAAKGGVIALTKALAREWASQRINVNAVAPGFVAGTRLTAARAEGDDLGIPADVLAAINDTMPLGRPGAPRDVAGAVAFLASTDADWITGQCLEVSGGREFFDLL